MRGVSFDLPPLNGKGLHQVIDDLVSIMCSMGSEMRIFAGRQDAAVTKDFLYLKQINTGFDQMSGKTVSKRMRGNLFFIPQASTTLRRVFCTPPRSSGVVAV
jgi:hypothetical protein